MGNHSRFRLVAVIGMLTLGAASAARAQDTSGAARSDTSGYRGYQNRDTTRAGAKMSVATADTVVCKDGSNAPNGSKACKAHGGVDSVATKAALKARGQQGGAQAAESTKAPADTTQMHKKSESGYQYNGPPSDTALKAKPGTQTGADTSAKGDTSSGRPQGP